MPTRDDLFLAYRQAKITLYFDRRGVGLLDLARFEERLEDNLDDLARTLESNGGWFDGLPIGEVWIVPKRIRARHAVDTTVTRIGAKLVDAPPPDLDVQIRLSPSPQVAIIEVLFLWRFGPQLDSLLSPNAIGNRLDLREGTLVPTRRWLFKYWQEQYQEFKTAPITSAASELRENGSVLVLSADLASFYDTVDPSFLLNDSFVDELTSSNRSRRAVDVLDYRTAVASLVRFYTSYQDLAARRTGLEWRTGIPIGSVSSRLVANVSLATLDREIENRERTLCYRRYVDDIVIVARVERGSVYENIDSIISERIPHVDRISDSYRLNVDSLGRVGSEFSIQKSKCKAYHLAGPDGARFLLAIRNDYSRLVSDNRAFLDRSVLSERVARKDDDPILRVGALDRTLTVLRDADRLKLHHFNLSNKLRSIERAAVLLDPETAREFGVRTIDEVCSFLDVEPDWVENLNLAFRILRIGIFAGSWELSERIVDYMDSLWGTTSALQASIRCLYHRDRLIRRDLSWVWLRNYLHARRVEAFCSVMPELGGDSLPNLLRTGVIERTRRLKSRALRSRSLLLGLADLRSFDREDDWSFHESVEDPTEELNFGQNSRALKRRLVMIGQFTDICARLDDPSWTMSPARMFLCTRPPSYFDVARRYLYRSEVEGFADDAFETLLSLVNAVRGTGYNDPVGAVKRPYSVELPAYGFIDESRADPQIILGNLVVSDACFRASATPKEGSNVGMPILDVARLRSVAKVLRDADAVSDGNSLLILPELSIPRRWFRSIAHHVVRRGVYGLVSGLEYRHDYRNRWVYNQAFAVVPGPFQSVAAWPWTKRFAAREEAMSLGKLGVGFDPKLEERRVPRVAVDSRYGVFSVLICSELIEARRVSDLVKRAEVVAVPAWNRDTASFDHLIRSAGLQLHAIVAVANNGCYSDCRAWAPRCVRWERDLCRLVERGRDGVVSIRIPLRSLREFHGMGRSSARVEWQPLPPDWSSV